jgi:hypothetical protein
MPLAVSFSWMAAKSAASPKAPASIQTVGRRAPARFVAFGGPAQTSRSLRPPMST